MRIFITYFISVFLVPVLVISIFSLLLPKLLQESMPGILIQTALAGFISVWIGTLSFSIIGLQPPPLIVLLIGVVFFLNYLIVYDFKDSGPLLSNATLLGTVGSLSGVIIGGLYFF